MTEYPIYNLHYLKDHPEAMACRGDLLMQIMQ